MVYVWCFVQCVYGVYLTFENNLSVIWCMYGAFMTKIIYIQRRITIHPFQNNRWLGLSSNNNKAALVDKTVLTAMLFFVWKGAFYRITMEFVLFYLVLFYSCCFVVVLYRIADFVVVAAIVRYCCGCCRCVLYDVVVVVIFPVHIIALLHHHLYWCCCYTTTLLLLLNCTNMTLMLLLLLLFQLLLLFIVPYQGIYLIRFTSFLIHGSVDGSKDERDKKTKERQINDVVSNCCCCYCCCCSYRLSLFYRNVRSIRTVDLLVIVPSCHRLFIVLCFNNEKNDVK